MTAIHGGQANTDPIDAQNIAVLRRGGRLPQAAGSPAERRATRDLRRRRRHLARTRGARLAPVQPTNRPSDLPPLGQTIADNTTRDGVAERVADPAVHQRSDVARARITADAARRRDVERPLVNPATPHDATILSRLHTVPGLGQIRSLVRLDDSHPSDRVPRGQDVAADGRLVTCAKAAAGHRSGTSGTHIGQAHLTWAFSAAAVFCLRDHPAGQTCLTRLAHTPRQGQALTSFAHHFARAV